MERKKIKSECNFIDLKNKRFIYRCKEFGKKCTELINESIKNFPSWYEFCKGNPKKFAFLPRKVVYPYEHMDSWEKFNEESLPDNKDFYSELNEKGITDKDYAHAQKVWEVNEMKKLG